MVIRIDRFIVAISITDFFMRCLRITVYLSNYFFEGPQFAGIYCLFEVDLILMSLIVKIKINYYLFNFC